MDPWNYDKAAAQPLDLTNCDKEQIHVPGSIQTFGALVCFDENRQVTRFSDNLADWLKLNCEAVAKLKADDIFPAEQVNEILKERKHSWYAVRTQLKSGIAVDTMLQLQGREMFLDIVPVEADRSISDSVVELQEFVNKAARCNTITELANAMAQTVRDL